MDAIDELLEVQEKIEAFRSDSHADESEQYFQDLLEREEALKRQVYNEDLSIGG